jgi:integrase
MAERITDRLVNDADNVPHKGQRIIFDDDITGFGVRFIAPSRRHKKGLRAFILDYRFGGAQRRYTIGRYPTWSVEAARKKAKELRKSVEADQDPMAERDKLRTAPTVTDLAERYRVEHLPSKSPQSQADDCAMIEGEILPIIGKRKVADIHQGDIKALHRAITKRGARVRANRVLAVLSKMFSLSLVPRAGDAEPWRDAVKGNPCKGVPRNPEEGRERFFSEAEIDRIAEALAEYPGRAAANLIRFAMLTGCRPGEARLATWDQFDLDAGAWTKPSARTKQRKLHRVPLSPPAVTLLQQARAEMPEGCSYVFPGRKRAGRPWEPLKQYRTCWEFVIAKAELAPDADGHAPRVYDLRHSFAATGAGQGLSLYIVGKLLGHTQMRTTQRYAHLADDPLRAAAEKISGRIANAGKASDNVEPLKGGRRHD